MDVDGPESGTQNIYEANDYGVEVDFDELDETEQDVSFFLTGFLCSGQADLSLE